MLNMNFAQRVVIDTESMPWVASPAKGVWRKPLEREDVESGHTTSVVRYDAGSHFSTHPHPMGEEIFVLEGVFSDEQGTIRQAPICVTRPAVNTLLSAIKVVPSW